MHPEKLKNLGRGERIALALTERLGSVWSIVLHSLAFVAIFGLLFFGVALNTVMLILTTAVSLEAIYLSLFIQMSVNRAAHSLEEVEEDVAEIAEDVEEIEKDVDEIQKDVEEIEKDVDEVQEDVEGMEEHDNELSAADKKTQEALAAIQSQLQRVMNEIQELKK